MDQPDPYKPPESEISPPAVGSVGELPVSASPGLRFLNLLIDFVGQFGLTYCISFAIFFVWGEAGFEWMMSVPDIAFGVVVTMVYYVAFEWAFGRTIGKFITGTKAVTSAGGRLGMGAVLARSACRLIPFEAFSFLGSEARGWHDSMTNTYVVKCR